MLGTNVRGRPAFLLVIARLLICACSLKAFGFDDSDASFDEVAHEEFEDSIAAQFVPTVYFSSCEEGIAQHQAHFTEVDARHSLGFCMTPELGAQWHKHFYPCVACDDYVPQSLCSSCRAAIKENTVFSPEYFPLGQAELACTEMDTESQVSSDDGRCSGPMSVVGPLFLL